MIKLQIISEEEKFQNANKDKAKVQIQVCLLKYRSQIYKLETDGGNKK